MEKLKFVAASFAALVVVACGGGSSPSADTPTLPASPTADQATPTQPQPTATPTPEPSMLIAYEVLAGESERNKSFARTNLVAVDLDTGNQTLLVESEGLYIANWAWSPDGQLVAVQLTTDSQDDPLAPVFAQIDIVSTDGGNRRTLYEGDLGVNPLLAPDEGGQFVTFAWSSDSKSLDIIESGLTETSWFRVPVDSPGSRLEVELSAVTGYAWFPPDASSGDLRHITISDGQGNSSDAIYSADGAVLAVVEPTDGFLIGGGEWGWTADGSTLGVACYRTLPDGANEWAACLWNRDTGMQIVEGVYGAISPDGNALLAPIQGGTFPLSTLDIGVYDIESGAMRQITTNGWSLEGTWSPDGSEVAYVSTADGTRPAFGDLFVTQLFVMTATGDNVRMLTQEPLPVRNPKWQPR